MIFIAVVAGPIFLLGLKKPTLLWLCFPLFCFHASRFIGVRTHADIYSPHVPYGYLLGLTFVSFIYVYQVIKKKERLFLYQPLFVPCLLFLLSCLFSLIDAYNVKVGFFYFLAWTCYITTFYIVANALRYFPYYKYFLIGHGINLSILTWLIFSRAWQSGFKGRAEIWDLTWFVSTEIGYYSEPILCITLCLFIFQKEKYQWQKWSNFVLFLSVVLSAISAARGMWISLGVALIFLYVRFLRKFKVQNLSRIIAIVSIFFIGISLSESSFERMLSVTDVFETYNYASDVQTSTASRWYLVQIGASIIFSNPINGVGLGNYQYHYFSHLPYVEIPSLQNRFKNYHTPHNFFLRFGSETGILGFSAVLYLLFSIVLKLERRSRKPYPEPWRTLVIGCYVGFISNLTHLLFMEQVFSFYFWIFVAIIHATIYHAEKALERQLAIQNAERPA